MATTLTRDDIAALMGGVADGMIAAKDELTALDAELGDGDLGRTIERGFNGIKEALAGDLPGDAGRLLFQLGKAFGNAAPSSFGALYSTALMKGGMALKDKESVTLTEIADATETAEAWEIALNAPRRPTVLALSRQNLPAVRGDYTARNLTAQGAYVLAEATGKRQAIVMATGSEVEVALGARAILEAEGIGTRVVSMPCMELFAAQDEAYRRRVLPAGPVRVAVEAAVRQPWDRWLLGERGREARAGFVGMTGFGASAPAERLFAEFGITAEAVAQKVRDLI